MSVINSNELRNILIRHTDPHNIKISDRIFSLVPAADVQRLLNITYINKYKWSLGKFDCDDFALILHAYVRQYQYQKNLENPLAFGEVWGRFSDTPDTHAMNCFVNDYKQLILVEPQKDTMRNANVILDNITFVRM